MSFMNSMPRRFMTARDAWLCSSVYATTSAQLSVSKAYANPAAPISVA